VEPRQLAIVGQDAAGLSDGPAFGAALGDPFAQLAIDSAAVPEEVGAPRRLEAFADAARGSLLGVEQRRRRHSALGHSKLADQGALSRPRSR